MKKNIERENIKEAEITSETDQHQGDKTEQEQEDNGKETTFHVYQQQLLSEHVGTVTIKGNNKFKALAKADKMHRDKNGHLPIFSICEDCLRGASFVGVPKLYVVPLEDKPK